ncbi:hypothetical protein GCM10027299_36750 [Larkinella ripae]
MVEVFKTDVNDRRHATSLITQIHLSFRGYAAHFDLEDCDKILRIQSVTGLVNTSGIIEIVQHYGFKAEVLPD